MRILKRNKVITILGRKIANTYLKSQQDRYYPIENTTFTKFYKDYKDFFWVIKKVYFKYRVLKVIKPN